MQSALPRFTWAFALLGLILCLGVAESQGDKAKVKTFIGSIDGAPANARIAVVTEGDRFVAYLCSGDAAFNETYSRWLKGSVKDGAVAGEAADGVKLVGTLKDDVIDLKLTLPNDKTFNAKAKELSPGGIAGLYRAERKTADADMVFGWIIDREHGVVGAKRVVQVKKGVPQKTIIIKTVQVQRQLPPPPKVIVLNQKQQIFLEQEAAEVVQEVQGEESTEVQQIVQGQRVIGVDKLPQGVQKKVDKKAPPVKDKKK